MKGTIVMSESLRNIPSEVEATPSCAQCGTSLTTDNRVASGDRVFCRGCYASLRAELEQAVAVLSTDVPYAKAALGAVLGGVVGVCVWWGFTVITQIAFGLVAVAIGFLVGQGAVRFAGGKRSKGLQGLSIAVALASYAMATYLVNMTFINRAIAEGGDAFRVAFPPQSLELFFKVMKADFGIMDFVFLAIVVYEAWKIPRPLALPPAPAA
jgi:hypothetical protein